MMCNLIFWSVPYKAGSKNKGFVIKSFLSINQLWSYFHIFQQIPHFSKLHSLHPVTLFFHKTAKLTALSLGCHSAMITVECSRDVTNHRRHFNTSLEDSCPELNSILHLQQTPNGRYFALFRLGKETRWRAAHVKQLVQQSQTGSWCHHSAAAVCWHHS